MPAGRIRILSFKRSSSIMDNAIGRIPFTGRTSPSRESSPTMSTEDRISSSRIWLAPSMAHAMGRSNAVPCFRRDAGEMLIVILFAGRVNPEFLKAVRTLSLDSLTSVDRNPTISNTGRPSLTSASHFTWMLSMPKITAVSTELYIIFSFL